MSESIQRAQDKLKQVPPPRIETCEVPGCSSPIYPGRRMRKCKKCGDEFIHG